MFRAAGGDTITRPVEVLGASAVAVSCASTAVDEVLASFTIPAGTLGVNSIIEIAPLWSYTNSANNKTLKVKIGGVTVYGPARTTTERCSPLLAFQNRNSLTSQIQSIDGGYFATSTGATPTTTIDFSVNVTVQITGQRASGADTLTLECYRVLHYVGD